MPDKKYDLITIGAGPAGYTIAIYATRYKLKNAMIAEELGGLMMYSDLVENYPGFPSINGPDLMKNMKEHANSLNVETIEERVISVKKNGKDYLVETNNKEFITKTVCFATGTERRKLNVPGEEENIGMGVSYCATCDAPFFRNRTCCVIGGSDSAAKEALVLSKVAKKVYIIYRKKKIRAEPLLADRVYSTENIEVIHDANVLEICTNEDCIVDRVKLDVGSEVKTNGVFIEIGFDPRSLLAADLGVKINDKKEIIVDAEGRTNLPGIFAAGDVTNNKLKQAITAAGEGAKVSWAAYQYIELNYKEKK